MYVSIYPKFQNKVDAYNMSVSISIISRVKGWMSSVIERVKDIFGVCLFISIQSSHKLELSLLKELSALYSRYTFLLGNQRWESSAGVYKHMYDFSSEEKKKFDNV